MVGILADIVLAAVVVVGPAAGGWRPELLLCGLTAMLLAIHTKPD